MRDTTPLLCMTLGGEEIVVPLSDGAICGIGRSERNRLRIPSEIASRQHAVVQQNDAGRFCVFDLGSRNGTVVNGVRIHGTRELTDGDTITVGGVPIVFRSSSGQPAFLDSGIDPARTRPELAIQNITILVTDFRGFTMLSREVGEKVIGQIVSRFNERAGRVLRASGVSTAKHIGDALMAAWTCETGAETRSAVRALEVFLRLMQIAEQTGEFFGASRLRLGAGINLGRAVAGNVGSAAAVDHTVLGDAVNKAFRLQAGTRELACDLAFGSEFYTLFRQLVPAQHLVTSEHLTLKGYAEGTAVYGMHLPGVVQLLESLGHSPD